MFHCHGLSGINPRKISKLELSKKFTADSIYFHLIEVFLPLAIDNTGAARPDVEQCDTQFALTSSSVNNFHPETSAHRPKKVDPKPCFDPNSNRNSIRLRGVMLGGVSARRLIGFRHVVQKG